MSGHHPQGVIWTPPTSVRRTWRSSSRTTMSARAPGASTPRSSRPSRRAGAVRGGGDRLGEGSAERDELADRAIHRHDAPASVPSASREAPPATWISRSPIRSVPSALAGGGDRVGDQAEALAGGEPGAARGLGREVHAVDDRVTVTSGRVSATPAGPGSREAKRRWALWMWVIARAPRSNAAWAVAASASVWPMWTTIPRSASAR